MIDRPSITYGSIESILSTRREVERSGWSFFRRLFTMAAKRKSNRDRNGEREREKECVREREEEREGERERERVVGGGMWGGDWCCSRVGTTRGGSGWPRRRRRRRRLSWTKSILWPPIPRHPFASSLQSPPSTPLRPNPPGSPPKVAE